MWKSRLGKEATYRALIEVFIRAGQVSYAQTVADILSEKEDTSDSTQHRPGNARLKTLICFEHNMVAQGVVAHTCEMYFHLIVIKTISVQYAIYIYI